MLFFRAKTHDILHSPTVVPTAIKDDDFTGSGEVRHITLHVHLTLLTIRRGGKGNNAEYPRAHTFRDRLDRSTFPAPSRPSNKTTMRRPLYFTQS